jgi:nitrogen fixation/metabolism regulation signal transduction histidine kinase
MVQVHRRSIRNYLLDSKLQLRYTLVMVMISSMLVGGLGYIWYSQMRETSKSVEVKALVNMPEEAIQELQDEMASADQLRLLVLVGFGLLFAIVVAGGGIMLTHKVAGPLFKITRYMAEIKEGRLGPVYDLRRGDQLRDFFDSFKQMHSALRASVEADVAVLNEVIQSTESHLAQLGAESGSSDLEGHLEALRELRDQKDASLKA